MSGGADKVNKQLQICPKCAGYMRPLSPYKGGHNSADWKDESFKRSFGGIGVKKFVCEKCHHVATFQADEVGEIGED